MPDTVRNDTLHQRASSRGELDGEVLRWCPGAPGRRPAGNVLSVLERGNWMVLISFVA
jgi:hypothetical protein